VCGLLALGGLLCPAPGQLCGDPHLQCDLHSNVLAFNASAAGLVGQLPSLIGDLVELTYLDLSGNAFSGPIPVSICNLTKLNFLQLCASADGSDCVFQQVPLCVWDAPYGGPLNQLYNKLIGNLSNPIIRT
jgi:hypothetical protein